MGRTRKPSGTRRNPTGRKKASGARPSTPRTAASRAGKRSSSSKSKSGPKTTTASRRPVRKVGPKRRKPAQSGRWTRVLRGGGSFLLRAAGLAFIAFIVGTISLIVYARGLPSIDGLEAATAVPRIEIRDRHGEVIGVRGQDRGAPVDPARLPAHVRGAFIATEDRNFYHHVGVNPVAVLRALIINFRAGDVEQGGSTITQQLVKNLLLTPERTMKRKVQEMLLALKIEGRYDKDEILGFYLNAVYFGNGAYGLEAASRRYFGKRPEELSIGEAAMLAGLLKAPSKLAPTRSEDAARDRARLVLDAMVEARIITPQQAKDARLAGIARPVAGDTSAAYAADHAVTEAERLLGRIDRDIVIETTIDAGMTRRAAAERAVIAAEDPAWTPEIQTAILALEESGEIRVLIGGNDYATSVYNRATQARRQPGSVFKTFVYLAALEDGWRPEDQINDAPVVIAGYEPGNYKDRYYGPVSLTEAMYRSLNAAAIRLQERVGRPHVIDVARRLGLGEIDDSGPSLALGVMSTTPLDVARSFLPLSNGGHAATPYIVDTIRDADGRAIYRTLPSFEGQPVIDAEVLVAFDHMLRSVVTHGSGVRARVPGHVAAGKTGTSQDSRDAWFAGYASGMVGVVWVGRDDDRSMEGPGGTISGSRAPAQIWAATMATVLEGRQPREPVPYVPRPQPKSLFEHLADVLNVRRPERVEPAEDDAMGELLGRLSN
jgi:penicillin-binding protein 1A